jgi:hypothetical protein
MGGDCFVPVSEKLEANGPRPDLARAVTACPPRGSKTLWENVNRCLGYIFCSHLAPHMHEKLMVIGPRANVIWGMTLQTEQVTPREYEQYMPRHMEAMRIQGIWRERSAASMDDKFCQYEPVIRPFTSGGPAGVEPYAPSLPKAPLRRSVSCSLER